MLKDPLVIIPASGVTPLTALTFGGVLRTLRKPRFVGPFAWLEN
jgi:hypothetical protein